MGQDYETYTFETVQTINLNLYLYRTTAEVSKGTILYLHGGGLVYGSAHDLPSEYMQQINKAGYHLVAIAYPLAPEVKLDIIIRAVSNGIKWFQEHAQTEMGLEDSRYILFGRSAGAYLAVNAAHELTQKPDALWLFYGYHTLRDASFQVPSRHYLTYTKVTEQLVKQLKQSTPLIEGPKQSRFALYIYYRQSGKWIADILPPDKKALDFSLTPKDLQTLPPAFLTASQSDPDVPYRLSKTMAQHIPNSVFETVDSDEHDFDRLTVDGIGKDIYGKALAFLNTVVS